MDDIIVLYWVDKTWQRGDKNNVTDVEVLEINTSRRCFKYATDYISPSNYRQLRNAAEVLKQSDIESYITYLKGNGYREFV